MSSEQLSPGYYHTSHLARFGDIRQGHAELAARFFDYYGAVFAPGELNKREKALIALAVAHAVQCPYCIDAFTSGSLEAGADLGQMTEAVHVAAAVRGGSVLRYAMQMLGRAAALGMDEVRTSTPPSYFSRQHLEETKALADAHPTLHALHDTYEEAALFEGELSAKEKAGIALAVAHAVQCPYSIDRFTVAARDLGTTLGQMTEAVHVATAIRGGASLVHGLQMLEIHTARSSS